MQDIPESGLEEISLQDFTFGRSDLPKSHLTLDVEVFDRLSNVAQNL